MNVDEAQHPRQLAAALGRLNWTVAIAFTLGGALFAVGAWVAQVGSGEAVTSASIYLAGGVFFSTGGYGSVLQAINEPVGAEGRWRWWSYQPMDLTWLAPFVLFCGTLAFGVSLVSAFMEGLSIEQQNRLIWAPDMIGCTLFLISGRLGMVALHAEDVLVGSAPQPRLVDRRRQPARLHPLLHRRAGGLHQAGDRQRGQRRRRQLGHLRRRALLCPRRDSAGVRALKAGLEAAARAERRQALDADHRQMESARLGARRPGLPGAESLAVAGGG